MTATTERQLRETARVLRDTAERFAKGIAPATEVDHVVELWMLEREKVSAT